MLLAVQRILNSRILRNTLALALLLHVIAAIFSAGFYHSDEHFQILEFLNYKLGLSSATDLPIEFGQRIRPWLQPSLYLVLTEPFRILGDWNPFHWVLAIRLFSSLIGFLSLCGLALLSEYGGPSADSTGARGPRPWIQNAQLRKVALILAATLWFLPALHARHSSENLSGSVFFLTLSVLFLSERKSLLKCLTLGIFFGAAFELRYQCGFLVAGIYGYWLFFRRLEFKLLLALFSGTLITILLCTWLDHWGYSGPGGFNNWTFAPWNYFHYNLILNHVSDVDTHPIWDFFRSSFTETFPPLGVVLLTAIVLGWIAKPLTALTWSTLPLFLIHTLIGHKELRFLFPIAHAAPFLAVQFLDAPAGGTSPVSAFFTRIRDFRLSQSFVYLVPTGNTDKKSFWQRWQPVRTVLKILFALNLFALAASTLLPVWMPARFFEQFYHLAKSQEQTQATGGYANLKLYFKDKNPFDILGLPLNFYRPPHVELVHLNSWQELQIQIETQSPNPLYYFQVGDALPIDLSDSAAKLPAECEFQFGSLPEWTTELIRKEPWQRWTRRVTNWTLYRCSLADAQASRKPTDNSLNPFSHSGKNTK